MSLNSFQQALIDLSQAVTECFPTLLIKRSPSVAVNQEMNAVKQATDALAQSINGGGGGGGSGQPIAIATDLQLNDGNSSRTIYHTPNDATNHTYLLTVNGSTHTADGTSTAGFAASWTNPASVAAVAQMFSFVCNAGAAGAGSVGITVAPNTDIDWQVNLSGGGGTVDAWASLTLLN